MHEFRKQCRQFRRFGSSAVGRAWFGSRNVEIGCTFTELHTCRLSKIGRKKCSCPRIRDFLLPSYRREVAHSPVLLRVSGPAWSDRRTPAVVAVCFLKMKAVWRPSCCRPTPAAVETHRTSWVLHAETAAHIRSGVFIYDAISMR